MNTDLTTHIYDDLREYLNKNSDYSPLVVRKVLTKSKKFPLVSLIEENNFSNGGTTKYKSRELVDGIFWEINIYATDKTFNGKLVSNAEICDELKALVDNVMTRRYGLERLSCRPTPNLDETIYRITMRYSCDILVNKNRII